MTESVSGMSNERLDVPQIRMQCFATMDESGVRRVVRGSEASKRCDPLLRAYPMADSEVRTFPHLGTHLLVHLYGRIAYAKL